MFNNTVYLMLAFGLTLGLRLYMYRKFKKRNPEGDEISHLLMLKSIIQNEGKIPRILSRFLLNYNDYPNGFHKLISRFPLKLAFWEKYGGLLPIASDLFLLIWISVFINRIGGLEFGWLILYPFIRLLWSREARSNDFGERAFGVLTGNLYLGTLYLCLQQGVWAWLPLGLVGFFLSMTSSKFSIQAIAFFSITLSIATQNPAYVILGITAFLLTNLITGNYAYKVLRGQILYSRHYYRHRMKRTLLRNFYHDFIRAFERFKLSRFKFLFFENPIFMLLSNCPVNLAFLYLWGTQGFAQSPLAAFAFCGTMLCLLTSTQKLKFLGQPERYLEFSLLPMFAYLSQFTLPTHRLIFGLSLLVGLVAVFYQVNVKLKQRPDYLAHRKSYTRLRKYLAQRSDAVVMTIPLKCSNYLTYMLEKHRYVACFTHCQDEQSYLEYESLIPDFYPYPGQDLQHYIRQYGIEMIIYLKASSPYLAKVYPGKLYYQLDQYPVLFENEDFVVYDAAGAQAISSKIDNNLESWEIENPLTPSHV